MSRDYESLVIFKASGTEQELAQQAARVEEQIKKLGGRVESVQGMGRRRLAFRIARQTEGYYYVFRFHAPTEQVAELERLLRLNETIVRFMILSEDELVPAAPPPASQDAGRAGVRQAGPPQGAAAATQS